jgi:uncharacterized BrkB/YihY/UPF0761 family membrane protein
MFWMYIVSMVLLIGGEINAQISGVPPKNGAAREVRPPR